MLPPEADDGADQETFNVPEFTVPVVTETIVGAVGCPFVITIDAELFDLWLVPLALIAATLKLMLVPSLLVATVIVAEVPVPDVVVIKELSDAS